MTQSGLDRATASGSAVGGEVAGDGGRARRLGAGAAHERVDVVAAAQELGAGDLADEAAGAGDEDPHAGREPIRAARDGYRQCALARGA